MPLYEYRCVKCSHRFEKIESLSASDSKKCPKCGAKAERQLSAPAIQFKGSGWYVTDYGGKKSGSDSGKEEKASESKESKESAKDSAAKGPDSKESGSKDSTKDSGSKEKKADKSEKSERSGKKK